MNNSQEAKDLMKLICLACDMPEGNRESVLDDIQAAMERYASSEDQKNIEDSTTALGKLR